MSVVDAVRARRAVRDISPTAVDPGLLDRVVRLSLEAPSSWNYQSRSIVVVTDPRVREGLVHATGGQRVVAAAPVTLVFVAELDDPAADRSAIHELAVARGAWSPEVSRGSAEAAVRFQQDLKDRGLLREYAVKDAMIAASFCMLIAQAEGLVTAPMNGWDEDRVKKVISADDRDDLAVALVMSMGYAASVPPHPGRLNHLHIFGNAYGHVAAGDPARGGPLS